MKRLVASLSLICAWTAWGAEEVATDIPAKDASDTNAAERVRMEPLLWPTMDMVTPGGVEMLKAERQGFAGEIRRIKKHKPNNFGTTSHAQNYIPDISAEDAEKIIAKMENGAADTVEDNYRRFCVALAERIPTFGKAWEFFQAGEYQKARDTVDVLTKEKILLVKRGYAYDTLPPYCYCTVTMFEGESFGLNGALKDAAIRYQIVVGKMRGSMTFSATARMRIGHLYEQSGRAHYAVPYYRAMSETHIGLLSHTALLELQVRALRMLSQDQFTAGVLGLNDTMHRLGWAYTGPATQKVQNDLLPLMTAMMVEEDKDSRVFGEYSMNLVGNEVTSAMLRKGGIAQKLLFTNDTAIVGTDDWGLLKPREKQELLQIFQETYSERYREMIEHYYRNVSVAETADAAKVK